MSLKNKFSLKIFIVTSIFLYLSIFLAPYAVSNFFSLPLERKLEICVNCINIADNDWSIQSSAPLISQRSRESAPELVQEINIPGMLIRDIVYYPLYWFTQENKKAYKKLLHEKEYYYRFWSDKEPKDLNLENSEIIKQNYIVRDQPIVVYENENKKITTVCRIIESKDHFTKECINAFIIPGSLSTLDNNIFSFYDLLLTHSKQQNQLPIRLVIFGQYETTLETASKKTTYKPASFDALGEVLKRTLESLSEQYGKFDIMYAHSAGCKALASLLKRSDVEILPTLLHFDRGASSMYAASRNYFFGNILYSIAKYSGLALDIDQEIINFFSRCSKAGIDLKESTCLITGVEEDFVYPATSNLARSNFDRMPKELKFACWMFNPPEQINHSRAHHNWRLIHLNKSYLSSFQGNIEMLQKENLAESILRLSQTSKL